MPSSIQTLAAFAAGPLRRVTAQITASVTAGVCVAFLTHTYIVQAERPSPGVTEMPFAPAGIIAPRADRLRKAQEPAPAAATDPAAVAGVSDVTVGAGETRLAKRMAVTPRDDFGPAPAAPAAKPEPPQPPMAQMEEPGQPMMLLGAVPQRDLAIDDEFDAGTPARQGTRVAPILTVPLDMVAATADHVERGVVTLGNMVASIGRPGRRY